MFIECLDYCLITKSLEVKACGVQCVVPNSYPNDLCPSDHLPLITTLLI